MGNVRKIDGKIVSNQSQFLIIQVIIDNYSYACQVKSKARIIFSSIKFHKLIKFAISKNTCELQRFNIPRKKGLLKSITFIRLKVTIIFATQHAKRSQSCANQYFQLHACAKYNVFCRALFCPSLLLDFLCNRGQGGNKYY